MKKKQPLLSVCIPTYNRASYLRECLESLCQEGDAECVEVVVSDNASSDETIDVLFEYSDKLPLRWVIQKENMGADRNFDAVVNLAAGQYCWILGSDDVVEVGAVSKIIYALKRSNSDLLHFGYVQADISLQRKNIVLPISNEKVKDVDSLLRYLSDMPNVSMMFAFISSFVFRRSIWITRQERISSWVGTSYIHMLAMHAALYEGATLISLPEAMVVARGGNPNEFNSVPGKFIDLDARTANKIIGDIYKNNDFAWRSYKKSFQGSYPVKSIVGIAAYGGLEFLVKNRLVLEQLGYSKLLIPLLRLACRAKIIPAIGVVAKTLKKIKR